MIFVYFQIATTDEIATIRIQICLVYRRQFHYLLEINRFRVFRVTKAIFQRCEHISSEELKIRAVLMSPNKCRDNEIKTLRVHLR